MKAETDNTAFRVTPATRNEKLKAVNSAFHDLQQLDLQDGWRDVTEDLLRRNVDAERLHRKGAPAGTAHGITIQLAAKLFVVEHLLEGFATPDKWTVDDILHIRNEVLYAQAYAKRFHTQLEPWAAKWAVPFKEIDYAKLMQTFHNEASEELEAQS